MKIAISGHGRAGKDTAAEMLRECSTLRYVAGTSWWARQTVFDRFRNIIDYDDADACWHDRHNYREEWAAVIGEYNRRDPVRLYRDCLAEQDILTGVRWRREMLACRDAHIVDLWLWIERPGTPVDPTQEFGAGECDLTIVNDGTLEDLRSKLERIAKVFGIARRAATCKS